MFKIDKKNYPSLFIIFARIECPKFERKKPCKLNCNKHTKYIFNYYENKTKIPAYYFFYFLSYQKFYRVRPHLSKVFFNKIIARQKKNINIFKSKKTSIFEYGYLFERCIIF